MQEYATIDAEELRGGVGEMAADVAQGGCTEQGIANGMYENVGVTVAEEPVGVGNGDAAEREGAVGNKAVDIIAKACSDVWLFHDCD